MYVFTIFQKYILNNFSVWEKWPNVREAINKAAQGLGDGKKQFSNL